MTKPTTTTQEQNNIYIQKPKNKHGITTMTYTKQNKHTKETTVDNKQNKQQT